MTVAERQPGSGYVMPCAPGGVDSAAILDRLVRSGGITAGQAAQYGMWEATRPGTAIGQESLDEWMKVRPDVPGVKDFWGD